MFLASSCEVFNLESHAIPRPTFLFSCMRRVSSNCRGVFSELCGAVFKGAGSGARWPELESWNHFTLCETMGSIYLSTFQFPHLIIRDNNSGCLKGLSRRLNDVMHVKHSHTLTVC